MAQKCSSLLELPTEIRILIYEHIADMEKSDQRKYIVIKSFWVRHQILESLAATQVNRQIRREIIPIFYRNYTNMIFTHSERSRAYVNRWLAELVDNRVLESIASYVLYPLPSCSCRVLVDLTNVNHPVQLSYGHSEGSNHCHLATLCANGLEAFVRTLKTTGNGYYLIDKETVKGMMKVCTDVTSPAREARSKRSSIKHVQLSRIEELMSVEERPQSELEGRDH